MIEINFFQIKCINGGHQVTQNEKTVLNLKTVILLLLYGFYLMKLEKYMVK